MASRSQTRPGMSLEEFLRWPRIDERPYLEYFDGRIEAKVSPQAKHSLIPMRMTDRLNSVAEPTKLGLALPELRCSFAGRSIIPDVVFLLDRNILSDDHGEIVNEIFVTPDIHIEIQSPRQPLKKTREKIELSITNGCPLGWLFDPDRRTIDVYRPGILPERLALDGFLDGTPVLPGFRIAVVEVFSWLQYRAQTPADPGEGAR